ncbi:hypothetical protein DdX_14704 [Ditylenchus destructor]|uniref:Uncharacterized protein n=1 Tax=Ditylenchus destructor TaxID=166010 RepID=A0AAD4MRF9_9BILA|nr:hypothetical protein DdX_14704 [Ditylenchus destructor]
MLRASDIGNLIQVIILLLTLIIIQEVTAPADKRRDKPGGVTVSRNKEHLDVKAAGLSIKNSPYNPDHERYKSRPDSRSRNKVDALRTPGNDGGSRSRSSSFIERRTVIEGTVSQPAERGVLNPEMPVTKEEKIVQSFTNAFEFWSAKQDMLKENGLADSDDVDDEEEDDGAFE